jgi:FMN reductase
MAMTFDAVPVVGVSGSPGATSRSRTLLEGALGALERYGARARRVDLAGLPADGLLGRRQDPAVADAVAAVLGARILVVSTPIYRATYSGLLKVFFDLLPQDALAGKVAVVIATGATPAHLLAVDYGLRPLLASVGAVVAPTSVYGVDSQFRDAAPDAVLVERVERAVAEAAALAGLVPALES